ncbi:MULTISPECIES: hypothetical protein [Burkholderia]|nr:MULTISPECIES: hypothetical protein [Burkholderia]HDR9506556.1 hypothetical protein [Burkholderia cepacia]
MAAHPQLARRRAEQRADRDLRDADDHAAIVIRLEVGSGRQIFTMRA